MSFYHEWALRILRGEFTDHHAFYGLPGYAFLLAGFYWVFGVLPKFILFVQVCLDAVTASFVFVLLGAAIASAPLPDVASAQRARAGLVFGALAALGWVVFVPAQALSIILMPTAWMVCAFWGCVLFIVRRPSESRLSHWGCFGLVVGVSATLVATILFLLPLALAAIVADHRALSSKALRSAALSAVTLVAGVLLGASPVWLHNYFVARDPVFLTAHSGINFWIGNHPEANGYPKIPAGLRAGQAQLLQDSIRLAEAAAGRPLPRSEVSRYWSDKAWAAIRQNPAAWVHLLGIKFRNFWNAYSYDDITIIALIREEGALCPGIGFGLVAALGLAGLVAGAGNPAARWIAAAVLLHMLSLMPVFITERYRLAAAPGLIVLGSYGLWRLWTAVTDRRWPEIGLRLAVLAGAAACVYLPKTDAPLAMEAYNLAIAEIEVRQYDRALQHLEQARALRPTSGQIYTTIGSIYQIKEDRETAKKYYQAALKFDPRNNGALSNLGQIAMAEGAWDLAEKYLATALACDPTDDSSAFLLAKVEWQLGKPERARAALTRALQLQPAAPGYREFAGQIGL